MLFALLVTMLLVCVVAIIVTFAFFVNALVGRWTGRKRKSHKHHDTSINDLINCKNDRDE